MEVNQDMIGQHVLVEGKRTGKIEKRPRIDIQGMPVGPGALGTWAALPEGRFVVIPTNFKDWARLNALRAEFTSSSKSKASKDGA